MKLEEHPTVREVLENTAERPAPPILDAAEVRRLGLEAGADGAGWVALGRPELADQRPEIVATFPWARSVISLVGRMNPESIRTPARSIANLEFHHTTD